MSHTNNQNEIAVYKLKALQNYHLPPNMAVQHIIITSARTYNSKRFDYNNRTEPGRIFNKKNKPLW